MALLCCQAILPRRRAAYVLEFLLFDFATGQQLGQRALEGGADIADVETLSVRERIARMKYLSEEEAPAGIDGVRADIESQLAALGKGPAAGEGR